MPNDPVEIHLDTHQPQLHAVQFSALVKHYLHERQRHLDPITIKGYRLRLDYFLDWWQTEGPDRRWLLDEDALGEYAQFLQTLAMRLSWHSRNDALRRLRQVLRWAHQRGYVAVNFAEFVPGVRGNPPPRMPVGLDVLRALFDACQETKEPERNRAMIAVLAGTGVRCEECASLRVEDVLFYEDGSGLIRLAVAKNDRLRTVAFDSVTGSYICDWVIELPYQRGPLFPSRNRRKSNSPVPLSATGLHKIMRVIADLAEVGEEIHGPHDLRRMFATTWARALPGQGHLLQKQMGHASYTTTLLYVLDDPTDIREAINKQPVTPVSVLAARRLSPQAVQLSLSDKAR